MKFNKSYLPLVAAGALLATACTEEVKYTPAESAPLTEVYFPTTNVVSQDLVDGQTSFAVTIARADANGEKTYAINSTVTPAGDFVVPESVTFADGESVKEFNVEFDLENIEVNTDYVLKLELPGIETTPYSYGTMEIHILYLPWKSLGTGWYREGLYYGLFNGLDLLEYEVEIQAHPTTAGIYRLVNPYDPEKFPYSLSFFGAYDSDNDYYIIINAENPDLVYLDRAETGIILDGTPTSSWSAYGNLLSQGKTPDPSTAGTLKNGVITMPERSLLNLMDIGDGYGAYYGNIEGSFRVVLPGYEKPTEWENIGMADFTDGFYGKFLLGADFTPTPYKVLVQKSLVEEGQYRIVDPYGASGYDAPESSDNYFYIDASNPDCVLWQYTTGSSYLNQTVILGTEGDFMIASNKATAEEVADAEMGGKFADEIFTVSADHTGYYVLGRLPVFRPNNIEAVLDLKNMEPWEPAEEETPASLKSLRVF